MDEEMSDMEIEDDLQKVAQDNNYQGEDGVENGENANQNENDSGKIKE